jgi:hypothetical protein
MIKKNIDDLLNYAFLGHIKFLKLLNILLMILYND